MERREKVEGVLRLSEKDRYAPRILSFLSSPGCLGDNTLNHLNDLNAPKVTSGT